MSTPRGGLGRAGSATLILCAALILTAAGCGGKGRQKERAAADPDTPPPAYADVARAHNERVASLGRLFARTVITFWYRNEDGDLVRRQGEGNLQLVLPDRMALSVHKAGHRLFWIGANAERYWFFDLTGDERIAYVGRHDLFGPDVQERLGLTVPPRQLITMFATRPLPRNGATQWLDEGRSVGATAREADGGYLRMCFDPDTFEPFRIELFDADQRLAANGELGPMAMVDFDGIIRGRTPGEVVVTRPGDQSAVRIRLYEPRDGSDTIAPDAFDFVALTDALAVDRVIDVDLEPAGG